MKFSVREIKTKKEMTACLPLLKQLTPELTSKKLNDYLEIMLPMGYRLFCVYENKNRVGCTGIWKGAKFYCGKYMEIDNFVIDKKYRSHGLGKLLTDYVIKLAKKEKCKVVMLDAYIPNVAAHKFYEREGFVKKGFHFIKKI